MSLAACFGPWIEAASDLHQKQPKQQGGSWCHFSPFISINIEVIEMIEG